MERPTNAQLPLFFGGSCTAITPSAAAMVPPGTGEPAGAGALVRDYFAQGFYPTKNRDASNRMPNISGALIKAALVASANFLEEGGISNFPSVIARTIAQSRGGDLGTVAGANVGVLGNNEQGYGRIHLSNVLPMPNWPPSKAIGAPNTVEYPPAGLLVFDDIGTGAVPIKNTSPQQAVRDFEVNSSTLVSLPGGGRRSASARSAWRSPGSIPRRSPSERVS